MIQANELRIGNCVTDIHSPNAVFRVNEIKKRICVFGGKLNYRVKYEDLLPIPLTEEILLKCGFEYDKYAGSFIKDDFNFDLDKTVNNGVNGFDVYIKNEEHVISKIKHLHQLQNLYFALTNSELECLKALIEIVKIK